jgi:hypothetical protein
MAALAQGAKVFLGRNRGTVITAGTAIVVVGAGALALRALWFSMQKSRYQRLEAEGNINVVAARRIYNELPENLKIKSMNFMSWLTQTFVGIDLDVRDLVNWFGQSDRYSRLFAIVDKIQDYEQTKTAFKYLFRIGNLDAILQKALKPDDYTRLLSRAIADKVVSSSNGANTGKYIISKRSLTKADGAWVVDGTSTFKELPNIQANVNIGIATDQEVRRGSATAVRGWRNITLNGRQTKIWFLVDKSAIRLVTQAELSRLSLNPFPWR